MYVSLRFKYLSVISLLYYSVGQRVFPVQFVKTDAGYFVWFCKKQTDEILRFKVTQYVAEKGAVQAQCSLAVLYSDGVGVEQNYKEAFKWFQKSAKKDCSDAQYGLGFLYAKGRGVQQSDKDAVYWFRRSAANGNVEAKGLLTKMMLEPKID